MTDAGWERLVQSVLAEIEPAPVARAALREKLRQRGDLELLYGLWCQGGDAGWLSRILARLARNVR